jgi:hypothetical protein
MTGPGAPHAAQSQSTHQLVICTLGGAHEPVSERVYLRPSVA